MMYQSIPVPMRTALSGLFGVGDDGSGEGGSEGSGIPGSGSTYETPTYTPVLAPGQSYNSSTNTIFDPITGNTMNATTGAILSGPVLGSGYQVPYQPSGSPSSGFNWGFLAPLANIFSVRYAVPQLNPGQTIQTGPGGTLMAQQPAGLPATGGLLTGSTGISTSTLLLFGGVGVVVMMLMKRGK